MRGVGVGQMSGLRTLSKTFLREAIAAGMDNVRFEKKQAVKLESRAALSGDVWAGKLKLESKHERSGSDSE